ncbi:MAG: hypothetical protein KJ566_01270 [Nanoarchaeota archaeon]|nr:hypothetical protein [Nanoarchaeota archaeon]
MKSLGAILKEGFDYSKKFFLPVVLSGGLLVPSFARDPNMKRKDSGFLSVGISQFNDKDMNEEWGNALPLAFGYNNYFSDNFRYEGSVGIMFNRKTASIDNSVVSYSQYTNLITNGSLQIMIPQKGINFFGGVGIEWSTLRYKQDSIDKKKPDKEKIEGAGMMFIGGAEVYIENSFIKRARIEIRKSKINPYSTEEHAGFDMGSTVFSAGVVF